MQLSLFFPYAPSLESVYNMIIRAKQEKFKKVFPMSEKTHFSYTFKSGASPERLNLNYSRAREWLNTDVKYIKYLKDIQILKLLLTFCVI